MRSYTEPRPQAGETFQTTPPPPPRPSKCLPAGSYYFQKNVWDSYRKCSTEFLSRSCKSSPVPCLKGALTNIHICGIVSWALVNSEPRVAYELKSRSNLFSNNLARGGTWGLRAWESLVVGVQASYSFLGRGFVSLIDCLGLLHVKMCGTKLYMVWGKGCSVQCTMSVKQHSLSLPTT